MWRVELDREYGRRDLVFWIDLWVGDGMGVGGCLGGVECVCRDGLFLSVGVECGKDVIVCDDIFGVIFGVARV
ncbi:hypothetical protein KMI_20g20020 [Encephalitozoon hellem]|nr:hypothetical protein KMI_20g20020 [Encephalitozoon hellem]